MSIVYYNNCSSLSGLTLVETEGTVTSSGGVIILSAKTTSANNLGAYGTANYGPVAAGWTFYCQVRPTGAINVEGFLGVMGSGQTFPTGCGDFRTGSNRDQIGEIRAATAGGGAGAFNAGNDTVPYDTWTDLKLTWPTSDSQQDAFFRPSDSPGAFDPNSSAWTEIDPATAYSPNIVIVGSLIKIRFSKTTIAQTIEIDEIYLTDDGEIVAAGSGRSTASRLIAMGKG